MDFRLRWIEIALGLFLAIGWFKGGLRILPRLRIQPNVLSGLAGLGFFLLATLAKYSQVQSGRVSGQDFWLFSDLLEQTWLGAPFLTRFAPQSLGWVQHGAVHPFLPILAYAPIAGLFGGMTAATLLNSSALALGGIFLYRGAAPKWGARTAVFFQIAFYLSSEVGRLHTYEAHPETLYPALVFLWVLSAQNPNPWLKHLGGAAALAAAMSLKADAILIFLPLIFWLRAWTSLPALFLSLGITWSAVSGFQSGALGPTATWQGLPIAIPLGPELAGGHPFSGPFSAWEAVRAFFSRYPDPIGFLSASLQLFMRGVFWNLVLHVPILLLEMRAWVTLLPLVVFLGLAGAQPAHLMNHYGAPLAALYWALVATYSMGWTTRRTIGIGFWSLLWALFFGSGGLEFYHPSPEFKARRASAKSLATCLDTLNIAGLGVVQSKYLAWWPSERIFSDRRPRSKRDWDQTAYIVASRTEGSYEFGATEVAATEVELKADWTRYGSDCQPNEAEDVGLWVRNR